MGTKKTRTLSATQQSFIEDRFRQLEYQKRHPLESQYQEQNYTIFLKEQECKLKQIQSGEAKIKRNIMSVKRTGSVIIDHVFTFNQKPLQTLRKQSEKLKQEHERKKQQLENLHSHLLDKALLGTPEQALAAIKEFEDYIP